MGRVVGHLEQMLGQNTQYGIARTDKVAPISELKFDPMNRKVASHGGYTEYGGKTTDCCVSVIPRRESRELQEKRNFAVFVPKKLGRPGVSASGVSTTC